MQFKNEVGAIIASDGGLINIFDGQPGHVDFPDELIRNIHKLSPGYINRFTHTHPPGLGRPSQQDNSMMSNLAMVMYPFPVRLGIIIPTAHMGEDHFFEENVYQWALEPRELWRARKMVQNDTKRAIVYRRVQSTMFTYRRSSSSQWRDWIIERSYCE